MTMNGSASNKRKTPESSEDSPPTTNGVTAPPSLRNPSTYISKLIVEMRDCLKKLNAKDFKLLALERRAILIHESMSCSSRNYHSVQHVFDISQDLDEPICVLAALFHDCIYYHVDGVFSKVQAEILKGLYDPKVVPHKFFASDGDSSDRLVQMVESVFGYASGEEITTHNGLNEYLSAVMAVRQLNDFLPLEILAQIACCIEATIPFRPVNEKTGLAPMDQLYSQMEATCKRFDLKLSDKELVKSLQRAAMLSNNDVGNFGSSDRQWFLDNTWSLLPETNVTLRQQYLYTVKEFHFGIFKMYGFFGFLNPAVVFHSFRGVPSQKEIDMKIENCKQNLAMGKKYVGAKLLSMSLLAAFAELTGGDGPMSLFVGDLPSRQHTSPQIEDSLSSPSTDEQKGVDPMVYSLLSVGRKTETSFDIRQSPLAAYIYSNLGDEGVVELLDNHTWYPIGPDNAKSLLAAFPQHIVKTIAKNMQRVALSRGDEIQAIVDSLPDLRRGISSSAN